MKKENQLLAQEISQLDQLLKEKQKKYTSLELRHTPP